MNSKTYFNYLILVSAFVLTFGFTANLLSEDEDLNVLKGWMAFTDNENALFNHLHNLAFDYLDKREKDISQLRSKEDWQQRQKQVKKVLSDIVGPFPEKTPLNPKITGRIKKQDFTVEKIVFESMPGFYVTSALFLPTNLKEKRPAVIYCSGHTELGFRSDVYQTVCLNLVKKGFIVLAIDPFGQGERWQYFDPATGESKIGGATKEHSYAGAQCFITGSSAARYMIWDGIRAVDYLFTRKEVDPNRIGITGRSGGGTQSAYIAAFDERILAAAPECYITNFKRLYESRGPQDAEQNFFHGIASGIDHPDLLEVRAPKPTLMVTTTRDFFSIQGVRETAREVGRVYELFGAADKFAKIEDDAPHASTPKNREGLYAFFQKHLNLPGDPTDLQVELFKVEELNVTKTGQLIGSMGGETVFSLNKKEAQKKLAALDNQKELTANYMMTVKRKAQELSGIELSNFSEAFFAGRYVREGYAVEKYFMNGCGNYKIPFLLFVPEKARKVKVLIYLFPGGKEAKAKPGDEIEKYVKQGYTVLAPDLLGLGEMGPGLFKGDAYTFKVGKAPFNIWFASIQAGKSVVGIRGSDVVRLVNFLDGQNYKEIKAVAKGLVAQDLIYAAAFDERIKDIVLVEPFVSYKPVVLNEYYVPRLVPATVAGALDYYDLSDLFALCAPRKLAIVNPVDHMENVLTPATVKSDLDFARNQYDSINASGFFQVLFEEPENVLEKVLFLLD